MKTLLIASSVGTVILFIFLAIVHTVLPIHMDDLKYTPKQDSILAVLNKTISEDGFYLLPAAPPNASTDERNKVHENMNGNPVAMILYHKKMDYGSEIFVMSLIYNFIAVLILCVALAAAINKLTSFTQRLWFVMLFALFAIFSQVMMDYNWYSFPMHFIKGSLFDLLVGYLLVGIWLAWYYGRKVQKQ